MKTKYRIKKAWTKPVVNTLSIKKDTFSGSTVGPETQDKTPNLPRNPTPR